MDPIRRKILVDGRRGGGDGRSAACVGSADWARRSCHGPSTKTVPFASTMRRPVPVSRCCSSPAGD